MATDLDPDSKLDIDDDSTERFAFQKCPHCSRLSVSPLDLVTMECESCGERFDVAPPSTPPT